jgi:hypothetical protein
MGLLLTVLFGIAANFQWLLFLFIVGVIFGLVLPNYFKFSHVKMLALLFGGIVGIFAGMRFYNFFIQEGLFSLGDNDAFMGALVTWFLFLCIVFSFVYLGIFIRRVLKLKILD